MSNTKRLPKIRIPKSPLWSMTVIGLFFILISIAISALRSEPLPSEPADRIRDQVIPPNKDQFGNDSTQSAPTREGQADDHMIALKHGPVMMASAFPGDWSVRSEGRQIIITSPSKSFICQSLVIPKKEYVEMVTQFDNDILQMQREIFMTAGLSLPPTATISVDAAQYFREVGSITRTGINGTVKINAGGRTIQNTAWVVWAVNDQNAASLSCTKLDSNSQEETDILKSMQAYTFSPE